MWFVWVCRTPRRRPAWQSDEHQTHQTNHTGDTDSTHSRTPMRTRSHARTKLFVLGKENGCQNTHAENPLVLKGNISKFPNLNLHCFDVRGSIIWCGQSSGQGYGLCHYVLKLTQNRYFSHMRTMGFTFKICRVSASKRPLLLPYHYWLIDSIEYFIRQTF